MHHLFVWRDPAPTVGQFLHIAPLKKCSNNQRKEQQILCNVDEFQLVFSLEANQVQV